MRVPHKLIQESNIGHVFIKWARAHGKRGWKRQYTKTWIAAISSVSSGRNYEYGMSILLNNKMLCVVQQPKTNSVFQTGGSKYQRCLSIFIAETARRCKEFPGREREREKCVQTRCVYFTFYCRCRKSIMAIAKMAGKLCEPKVIVLQMWTWWFFIWIG